jgi:mandelamide amidase
VVCAGRHRRKNRQSNLKGAFDAIAADAFGAAYDDALNVQRPALQKLYAAYVGDNNLDAILFPTTVAPAVAIDMAKGSGEMSINGGTPVPTFNTLIRNTDPGSNAGIPGLSLYAGMTRGGLPVGLEIDGPVGSDAKLLGVGLAMEAVLGMAPAPKQQIRMRSSALEVRSLRAASRSARSR